MTAYTKSFSGVLTGMVIALSTFATPSHAQDAQYLSQDASHCEIFRGLSRDLPAECRLQRQKSGFRSLRGFGRTRGLVVYDDAKPARVADASATDPDRDLSIAFRAEFGFDSAVLTPEAKKTVDRVAKVLKHDLMKSKVIQIEGHADAKGADAYNKSLSEKRADAVRAYLVSRHNIDGSRLQFVGKGESEPYDPQDPHSRVNRRVEFKNISG